MHFLHCNLNLCSNSANCVNSAPIGASALGTTMQRGPSGPAKNVENAFGKFSGNFFVKFFWKIFQFFFRGPNFFLKRFFQGNFFGEIFFREIQSHKHKSHLTGVEIPDIAGGGAAGAVLSIFYELMIHFQNPL